MLAHARDAVRALGGMDLAAFDRDRDRVAAVCWYLQIVGEASVHISEATQERMSGIPWELVRGMRNRLVHGYDDIDVRVVHQTVVEDLPPLIAALERALGR